MSESLIEVTKEKPVLWLLCKIFMTLFLIQVIILHFCLQTIFFILLSVLSVQVMLSHVLSREQVNQALNILKMEDEQRGDKVVCVPE